VLAADLTGVKDIQLKDSEDENEMKNKQCLLL
jgi:hypothetical protein